MEKMTNALALLVTRALSVCGGINETTKSSINLSGPGSVIEAGSSTFTATTSDASGLARGKFYCGRILFGTDTTAPYEQVVPFSAADHDSQIITDMATDTAGNTASAPKTVAVNFGGA